MSGPTPPAAKDSRQAEQQRVLEAQAKELEKVKADVVFSPASAFLTKQKIRMS